MSDYNEDLGILTREGEALVERENALYEDRGVPEGQPLVATVGDPEIQAMIRERNEYDARFSALLDYYGASGGDPHAIKRPSDEADCIWLPRDR